jgi:hypothetical protein
MIMPQILQIGAITLATLGGGAATMTVMKPELPDLTVPAGNWSAENLLDGTSFDIVGTDLDSGQEMTDTLVFRDGAFQSVNCQAYCDFGFSAYQTKVVGDAVHFTATTRCPDAPHTVVWYGSVTDDGIEVAGTWTTRRWYWSHQIRFEGDGSTALPDHAAISD